MSWRVVAITQRCKLDYSMNYMVVRGEETKRILLDEISVLVIENNAVSMTGCLLSMLCDKKIKVVLCDSKRNPQIDMVPLYGAHNDSKHIREQILWREESKTAVWTAIIEEKIQNQSLLLAKIGKDNEAEMLRGYIEELSPGDPSNREGHAAKVYFNALFGMRFSRGDKNNIVNSALNYGYSLLLSVFNREIIADGYLTQLGLGHDNQFNHFNLSCDLMEPFRVLVDEHVYQREYESFETEEKHKILDLLNKGIKIKKQEQTVLNAIRIYTRSVLDAIEENTPDRIVFFEL